MHALVEAKKEAESSLAAVLEGHQKLDSLDQEAKLLAEAKAKYTTALTKLANPSLKFDKALKKEYEELRASMDAAASKYKESMRQIEADFLYK